MPLTCVRHRQCGLPPGQILDEAAALLGCDLGQTLIGAEIAADLLRPAQELFKRCLPAMGSYAQAC